MAARAESGCAVTSRGWEPGGAGSLCSAEGSQLPHHGHGKIAPDVPLICTRGDSCIVQTVQSSGKKLYMLSDIIKSSLQVNHNNM
uniref:Uncharacterized protein n=1 Tax=Pyxicephalus adspersus TaxID=30357 RepID=A0AAV3A1K1_PYXAD|nr:TPA: hypothetical protein GDO54_015540 [Pyxicephalus adspersus]